MHLAAVAWTASIRHARTGSPSSRTVHAPQTPCSQPTCVPVSSRSPRRKSASVVRGSTTAVRRSPLTVTVIAASVMSLRALDRGGQGPPHELARRRGGGSSARHAGRTADRCPRRRALPRRRTASRSAGPPVRARSAWIARTGVAATLASAIRTSAAFAVVERDRHGDTDHRPVRSGGGSPPRTPIPLPSGRSGKVTAVRISSAAECGGVRRGEEVAGEIVRSPPGSVRRQRRVERERNRWDLRRPGRRARHCRRSCRASGSRAARRVAAPPRGAGPRGDRPRGSRSAARWRTSAPMRSPRRSLPIAPSSPVRPLMSTRHAGCDPAKRHERHQALAAREDRVRSVVALGDDPNELVERRGRHIRGRGPASWPSSYLTAEPASTRSWVPLM